MIRVDLKYLIEILLNRPSMGYNPKILNSIYENRRLTLYESVMADRLLLAQGITTTKIRADIYSKVLNSPILNYNINHLNIFNSISC